MSKKRKPAKINKAKAKVDQLQLVLAIATDKSLTIEQKIACLVDLKLTRKHIGRLLRDDDMFFNPKYEHCYLDAQIKAKMSPADALKAFRDRQREVEPQPVKDQKRKDAVEAAGLEAWLIEYFPEWFPLPFSPDHKRLISSIEARLRNGGLSAIAFPRGSGKTTILKAATIYAVAIGLRRYVVPILATSQLASSFLQDIKKQLTNNKLLVAQYPLLCACAVKCEDNAQRARMMNHKGKDLGFVWKKTEIVMPSFPGSRSAGAIIHPVGITASMRGLQKSVDNKESTEILRPDFVLIDDPQTAESAASPLQTRQREETINGDILGLAGPNKQISGFMTTTVITQGDLADRFLDPDIHPEWNGLRVAMVKTWPAEQDGMWREYAILRKQGMAKGDEGAEATAFYATNKEKMDEGAVVSWEDRKHPNELSALQHAENLLCDRGEASFWSEYQNQPKSREFELYEISPRIVTLRINNMKRRELDPMVKSVFAFSDINFSGLHWSVIGIKNDMSAFVVDYGCVPERGVLVPKDTTQTEIRRLVAFGLQRWFDMLAQMQLTRDGVVMPIRAAGVDRGFLPDVVSSVCRSARLPFPVLSAKGYGGTQYRPEGKSVVGKPGHYTHISDSQFGQFMAHNSDYFKEIVQRGFLVPAGAPGSISLYGKHPEVHIEYAEHICAESLADKAEGNRGMFWKWRLKPGACNDWLDSLAGCFAMASWYMGGPVVDVGMQPVRRRRLIKAKLRKPKVSIVE